MVYSSILENMNKKYPKPLWVWRYLVMSDAGRLRTKGTYLSNPSHSRSSAHWKMENEILPQILFEYI